MTSPQELVDDLKTKECIRTPRVEAAFRAVPRHLFVPESARDRAYRDESILTKRLEGKVVSSSSQPAIMAIMLEQLDLQPGHRVLEIGAGTGYNAALMAHIVGDTGRVVTVDIDDDLVEGARQHLSDAGFDAVKVICADGASGYPEDAPYDRVVLTVGAWDIVPAWREQLAPGGRLVLPLSIKGPQFSMAFDQVDGHLESVSVADCGFMTLRGELEAPEARVPLGPEPGLDMWFDERRSVDANALYEQLTGPSRDLHTSVRVTPGEIWGSLNMWLALRESGVGILWAEGEMANRGIVPYLFGHSGESKSVFTTGLLGNDGLCMLMRPPDESSPFELAVRSFGADDVLARRLIEQVADWDRAGRPPTKAMRIKAYPRGANNHKPSDSEYAVEKRSTRFFCGWSSTDV